MGLPIIYNVFRHLFMTEIYDLNKSDYKKQVRDIKFRQSHNRQSVFSYRQQPVTDIDMMNIHDVYGHRRQH